MAILPAATGWKANRGGEGGWKEGELGRSNSSATRKEDDVIMHRAISRMWIEWVQITYPFLADRGTLRAHDELLSGGGELGKTANGQILVVQCGVIVNGVVGLARRGQSLGQYSSCTGEGG